MRTLIVSLNARYEHENPAPWYLKASCDARGGSCGEVSVLSATINDEPNRVFAAVAQAMPDIAALSCYIWNRDLQLRLCADLHAAFPGMVLVVGGPEVSYGNGADDYLTAGAGYVLAGEGEARFPELLAVLARKETPSGVRIAEWQAIPSPLPAESLRSPCCAEYLARMKGRIAYIESSRGCPYRCAYCLSSESGGMTWIPLERVFQEIEQLVSAGAKVIKFVDRTFNLSEARTLAIWSHLPRYRDAGVVFHFEIAPDRLTAPMMTELASLPPGLVQIEAGIQSTHAGTLSRIDRSMDVRKALDSLEKVTARGNVHVHADLIAGLPGESLSEFAKSFDALAAVRPHHLQLGFLKLLRGTRLWRESEKWGYVYRQYAPYEVIASRAMTALDMLRLKEIEETVERFRNSGRFLLVLQWLSVPCPSEFTLYGQLADLQKEMGLLDRAVSSDTLFRCMKAFLGKLTVPDAMYGLFLLRLDWICAHRNPFLPDWLSDGENRISAETNHLRAAYGEGDEKRGTDARTLKNRYHAVFGVPEASIREGVRYAVGSSIGMPSILLIDTKDINPVTGRPDVVAIPIPEAAAGV